VGLALILAGSVSAQTFQDITFGISINPTITFPINGTSSNAPLNSYATQTYKEYADSIKSFESYKVSVGLTAWVFYNLNLRWSVQAGLGYSEVGFTRSQDNIRIGDKLYPGMGTGVLLENSNSVKNIDYVFRYQYVTVPILFNYFGKRSRDFKWSYYFTTGAALNVLAKNEIRAKLKNFYVEGENEYKFDSTGYEGRRVAVTIFLGGKLEYKLDKQYTFFAQPMITAFPMSVSKTEMKSFPIGLQVNCGVVLNLNGKEGDE
jgi:hypothetical protein